MVQAQKFLADPKIDINNQNREKATVLHTVVRNWERVKCKTILPLLLSQNNIDVNITMLDDDVSGTPLNYVEHSEVFEMLLAHPQTDINYHNYGDHIILSAVCRGFLDIVKLILADPRYISNSLHLDDARFAEDFDKAENASEITALIFQKIREDATLVLLDIWRSGLPVVLINEITSYL